MSVSSLEAVNHLSPAAVDDTWRTWLMTGTRRPPIDRRRVRGAHKGLKRMLVEGMSSGGDRPQSWMKFSGAMVRQAVDDGVRALPPQQKQLIKLAFFGGLSNAEIAHRQGLTISSVERGLRQAVARVSEYVERGREAGRQALYALLLFFCGRSLADALHPATGPASENLVRVAALAVVAATAGAVIGAEPTSPAQLTPVRPVSVPAVVSALPHDTLQQRILEIPQVTYTIVEHTKSVPAPSAAIHGPDIIDRVQVARRVTHPIALKPPPTPSVPPHRGLLGA